MLGTRIHLEFFDHGVALRHRHLHGKIVAIGATQTEKLVAIRLTSNGTADASFGDEGTAEFDFHFPGEAHSLAMQADGKLLVADWSTMQAVQSQAGPGSAIWSVALSPSGQQLAVATRKHGLAVVDTQVWLAAGQTAAEAARAVRPPAPAPK